MITIIRLWSGIREVFTSLHHNKNTQAVCKNESEEIQVHVSSVLV